MHTLPKLIITLPLAIYMGAAVAEENTYPFNIPSQSLASALNAVSRQTGLQPFYADGVIAGKQSPGLKGNYSKRQAVQMLLAKSGLSHTFTSENTVAVKADPIKKAAPPASTITLKPMTVVGEAVQDPNDPYNNSYTVTNSSTATKTDTPIMETPVSIQIVPKKVLDDQQAYNAREALKNVSGVQQSTSAANYENFVIRGFDASGAIYKNGIRQEAFAEETSNLERIEVLKGPAAMLYGRIEPGGLVNLQTAKPLSEAYYSLQQQFGSYDFYRTSLDATGPITKDKSLLYRLNFAYRSNNSYRDLHFLDRIFLAPSLTWNISDRTQANLMLEYQKDDFRGDYGLPAEGVRPAKLPINRSLSDPAAYDKQESQRLFADWSHAFNDDWKLAHRFMVGFTDYEQFDIFTQPPNIGDTVYQRGLWGVNQDRDIYATNIDLTGHFNTWGAKHSVLLGFDYYFIDQKAPGHCCAPPEAISTIDSINPVYGVISRDELKSQPQDFFFDTQQEWKGVYFQDQITLWDKLHILGGGRYDWATAGTGFSGTTQAEATAALKNNNLDSEKFSPRVGLLYRPWNWLSLYGNYTESIGANNGRTSNSQPLQPQTAQQFEAGFKTELLDKRLTSSVAFFHITKQNLPVADVDTPDPSDSKTVGEAISQGIEVDISGKLTDNWSLIGSYAYTDAKIANDASCIDTDSSTGVCLQRGSGNTSNRLPNAALHSGSFWTTYDFDSRFNSSFAGLSLGTGVFIVGQRQGDVANSFQLPGYVRWDASAAYKWDIGESRLTAQLNVRNILDKSYFSGANTFDGSPRGYGNIPGEPLTFLGSLKLEY